VDVIPVMNGDDLKKGLGTSPRPHGKNPWGLGPFSGSPTSLRACSWAYRITSIFLVDVNAVPLPAPIVASNRQK
jgi:hypothetical protein